MDKVITKSKDNISCGGRLASMKWEREGGKDFIYLFFFRGGSASPLR